MERTIIDGRDTGARQPGKSTIKTGLLPKLLIAIALGAATGLVSPDWVMRALNCFRDSFGQFIKFFVPFIIIGLVTPAISESLGDRPRLSRR